MKLIRKGEPNEESPGLLLPDGREVDVSSFGEDYDEVFFETNGLERLNEWLNENSENLPPYFLLLMNQLKNQPNVFF